MLDHLILFPHRTVKIITWLRNNNQKATGAIDF